MRATILPLLCIMLSFACMSEGYSVDNCTFSTSQFYYGLDNAMACMDLIQYNRSYAQSTIDSIKNTMQMYAFIDEVKNSSYVIPQPIINIIQVDVIGELDAIDLDAQYDSMHDFLQLINNIFFKLKDPHTYYVKSSCYAFFAAQPFALGSRMNGDTQEIYISGLYSYYKAPIYSGLNLQNYIGATIKTINGKDTVDEIVDHAREFGYLSKDPSCNFNFMLQSSYQQRTLKVFPYPEADQAYRLELNGASFDVVLPWIAIIPENVKYSPEGCTVNKAASLSAQWKMENSKIPLGEILLPAELREVHTFEEKEEEPLKRQLTAGRDINIYSVNDNVIAMKISDFVPSDTEAFLDTVNFLLQTAKDKDIDNLILDVRGNGGGDICLGYQVIHRLVEERRPEGRYDIIHSKLMSSIVEISTEIERQGLSTVPIFGPSWWDNDQNQIYHDESWYLPGEKHVRGGVTGLYSEKVYHSCNLTEVYPHHLFKKIVILSDGTCGSTCAVFTTHLQEVDHVKTIALGGIARNNKMQYFSFPGGQVMDMNSVIYFQTQLGITGDFTVKPFPDDASLRFTLLEIYPWLDNDPTNLPLEFMFLPADYKLNLWVGNQLSTNNLLRLYEQIVPVFNSQEAW